MANLGRIGSKNLVVTAGTRVLTITNTDNKPYFVTHISGHIDADVVLTAKVGSEIVAEWKVQGATIGPAFNIVFNEIGLAMIKDDNTYTEDITFTFDLGTAGHLNVGFYSL
jgi:hypothetical protein